MFNNFKYVYLGISPNFKITMLACGLSFHWYLRTSKFKKKATVWPSSDVPTEIVQRPPGDPPHKVLKYPRNYRLHAILMLKV